MRETRQIVRMTVAIARQVRVKEPIIVLLIGCILHSVTRLFNEGSALVARESDG
jgi:hypothetical protein